MTRIGHIPVSMVVGETLAEATYKAWKRCGKMGTRVANVKDGGEEPLAYDMTLLVVVKNPLKEPMLFKPGMPGDEEALESYRLEVVHGSHDHWVRPGDEDTFWDYTYHERMVPQIPLVLDRIEATWLKKGRITSRDFQLTTWQWALDNTIDDPPCLQLVHMRLLPSEVQHRYKLNLTVFFRSRDLGNAFWMNAYAFISFQKYLAGLIEDRLSKYGIWVDIGTYTDFSISNHLYGTDQERRHLLKTLKKMETQPWEKFAMDSRLFLPEERAIEIRHKTAAQLYYEKSTRGTEDHSIAASIQAMEKAGINWKEFPYPEVWNK
jgi:thymidylate synthase